MGYGIEVFYGTSCCLNGMMMMVVVVVVNVHGVCDGLTR